MEDKDLQTLLLLLIVGFLIYRFLKKGKVALGSSYTNTEEWEIIRDPKTGSLIKIVIHRKAIET